MEGSEVIFPVNCFGETGNEKNEEGKHGGLLMDRIFVFGQPAYLEKIYMHCSKGEEAKQAGVEP